MSTPVNPDSVAPSTNSIHTYLTEAWLTTPTDFSFNGFPCHRQVIETIPYFKGLLGGLFKEKTSSEITLPDVNSAIIPSLLQFVYIHFTSQSKYLTVVDSKLSFSQCLELYQLAEFLCYTELKTAVNERLHYIRMTEADAPMVLGHVANETDPIFRGWLVQHCLSDEIRWRLDLSTWSRAYLDVFLSSNLSMTLKFYLIMRWLVSRPKPLANADLDILKTLDLRVVAQTWEPLSLASLEMVFALNRPEVTAMMCRELLNARTTQAHTSFSGRTTKHHDETDWSTFQPTAIQFSPIKSVRDELHRIKMLLPSFQYSRRNSNNQLTLTLPPLRLVSVQSTPSDGSYTLRLEFPEPMSYQYELCRRKLIEIQEHCGKYLDTLDTPELAPFRTPSRDPSAPETVPATESSAATENAPADSDQKSALTSWLSSFRVGAAKLFQRGQTSSNPVPAKVSHQLIGIVNDSRGRPSILARTQCAKTRIEGSQVQIQLTDVPLPCWIRLTLSLYLAIGTKLSIVRTVIDSEVRLTS
jgi:hypothetical protein